MNDEELARVLRLAQVLNKMRKGRLERTFVALSPEENDDLFFALRALAAPNLPPKEVTNAGDGTHPEPDLNVH